MPTIPHMDGDFLGRGPKFSAPASADPVRGMDPDTRADARTPLCPPIFPFDINCLSGGTIPASTRHAQRASDMIPDTSGQDTVLSSSSAQARPNRLLWLLAAAGAAALIVLLLSRWLGSERSVDIS